jgi:hypothetical protein
MPHKPVKHINVFINNNKGKKREECPEVFIEVFIEAYTAYKGK